MKGISLYSRYAFAILLSIWVLSILVRIPQLNRPLAKHHEYNTAMVLMNIETWRVMGGHHFHYIPVLNYPNAGDRIPARASQPNFDETGNALYFSFGAAWYLFPYALYELFQWPADPVYLQILNLLIHGLGAWLWWRWLQHPARKSKMSPPANLLSAVAYLFLPGMLWYNGNGYVNTSLSLPLLIVWLMAVDKWIQHPRISNYGLFACMSLVCVYTDWFIVFLCASFALVESRKYKHHLGQALTNAFVWMAPVGLGILLILAQYGSYVGLPDTFRALSNRFAERSLLEGSTTHGQPWITFLSHYATLYFPILIWIMVGSLQQARSLLFRDSFFVGYGLALALYHLLLFQWSAVHEFAMLADVLWLLYGMGVLISAATPKKLGILAVPFLVACIAQYSFINPPGPFSRDGMPYQQYEDFGVRLQQLPKSATLFMDQSWTAELQYHAKRSIQPVADEASARKCMVDWKISEAYWIEHDRYQIRTIKRLNP